MNKPLLARLLAATLPVIMTSAALAEPAGPARLDAAALDGVTAAGITITSSDNTNYVVVKDNEANSSSVNISSTTSGSGGTTIITSQGKNGTTTLEYSITENGKKWADKKTLTGPNNSIVIDKKPGAAPRVTIGPGASNASQQNPRAAIHPHQPLKNHHGLFGFGAGMASHIHHAILISGAHLGK